ncbi:acetylglutamate kinase, argB [Flavobacteria bacterium BBFL7]|nr:acetylglutamate kinase, argB [Flavobacteria bacterium BBFL7]
MEQLKVIKIGGHIINDQQALDDFLTTFNAVKGPKVLIHGGGKVATELAQKMNLEVKMIDGRRITDSETLDIATMVFAGKVNKTIVAKLQAKQCNAIGFTGADGNTILSKKRDVEEVDFGYVGDVVKVDTEIVEVLLSRKRTPVFCAITHDGHGQLLNTNADTLAAELAIALAKNYETELYYCFEKKGVLQNISDENSVIKNINLENYQDLKSQGIIADGMLPKMQNCFQAIQNGVQKVCVGLPEMLQNSNSLFTTISN